MRYTINLSQGFMSIGQEIKYKDFIFPGGEVHIRLDVEDIEVKSEDIYIISSRCQNSNDFIKILLVVNALDNLGINNIELFIPYFPYARQDRIVNSGECFSLQFVCELLDNMCIRKIITYDIHSNKWEKLFHDTEIRTISNLNEVDLFLCDINKADLVFVSPDVGAKEKIRKAARAFPNWSGAVVDAEKKRNKETGRIVGIELCGDVLNKNCIIVDDICDGGATFIELGKVLKEKGAKELYLFVSHGIFSKGFGVLYDYYNLIGTTNSFRDEKDYEAMFHYKETSVIRGMDKLRIYNLSGGLLI